MTRTIDDAVATALAADRLRVRDFLWIIARDRATGGDVPDGMWSDDYDTYQEVVNPDTLLVESRTFTGVGALVSITDIPLVSNLTVHNCTISLSQVADHVATLVRFYECRQAKVQIFRGLLDPDTNELVAPAEPRFVGFVDKITINTPTENNPGSVELECVSHTQELTRWNADTRNNASQFLRAAGDDFYNDVAVVGSWQQFWGRASGAIAPATNATLPS